HKRYGVAPEQMTGKSVFDYFPHELAKQRLNIIKKIFETKKPYRESYSFVSDLGEKFWHDISLSPVLSADGKVYAVAGFIRDITAIKTREIEIYEEMKLFQTAIEVLPVPVLILDSSARIFKANEAGNLLFESTLTGLNISEFIDENEIIEQHIINKTPLSKKVNIISKNKEIKVDLKLEFADQFAVATFCN
ncbi:MAG: PAS domain-containing protein, partial [Vulcanimicrobiota bacterium]